MVDPSSSPPGSSSAPLGPARTIRLDRELPVRAIGARSGLVWSRDGLILAGIGRATELPIDR
ncbi:MAG: hypothetical protein AAFO29_18920, partial [Actinomycetota bacterium]